ncbi:MAG: Ig-like domain-containing protein, partial [Trebonia sp.]
MAAQHRRPDSVGARLATAAVAAVVVSAVAVGTLVLVHQGWAPSSHTTTAIAATGAAAPTSGAPASSSSPGADEASSSARTAPETTAIPVPLHLVAVTPDANQRIDGDGAIVVTFDEPLAANTLLPMISPAAEGVWSQPTPAMLRFDPTIPFVPDTKVTVDIPAGMTADNGGALAHSSSVTFRIADGSLLRLQQLLAELSYLPVDFTPVAPETNT